MSFLPLYCHSFCITVIPSGLLSFLLYQCHSFRISVIPSELLSFLPNYCHFKYLSSEQLLYPPIPKGREKWPPEVAIYASRHKNKNACSERISTHSWTCLPKYRWQNSHSSFTSYTMYVKPFGFAKTYTTYYIHSFNFLFSIPLNNHLRISKFRMGRTEETKI